MADTAKHFLLVYDARARRQLSLRTFEDADVLDALAAYEDAEREHREAADVKVYLFTTDSEATLRATHANLFGAMAEQADALLAG